MSLQHRTIQDCIPEGYERVQVVGDSDEFLRARFNGSVNLIVLPRPQITLDFNDVAQELAAFLGMDIKKRDWSVSSNDIGAFRQTEAAKQYTEQLGVLEGDLNFVSNIGYNDKTLRLLKGFSEGSPLHRIHPDGTDETLGRLLCCYNGPSTEFFRNDDVGVVSLLKGEAKISNDNLQPFSFPNGTMSKHLGIEVKPPVSRRRLRNAAFHRGVNSDIYCLRLVADKVPWVA